MSSAPPNLQDSHFDIADRVDLIQSDKRTFFMLINHDRQPIEVHMGPGDVTPGDGLIIPTGGHLTLPNGVLGPINILEAGGGTAFVTILSPIDEIGLATS